ncbi:Poly(ADP-ribose) polymerase, regulatory domain-containing protein, partial [Cynara cardunculus var. scolymus]
SKTPIEAPRRRLRPPRRRLRPPRRRLKPPTRSIARYDYSIAFRVQEKPSSKMEIQPRETKLEARVAKFISLICNVSMMKQQMMEIGLFPIPLLS